MPEQPGKEPVQDKVEANVQGVVEHAQQEVAESRAPAYRSSRRTQVLIGIYITEFVLFTLLAWFVHFHPILPLDVAITREFQENQTPFLKGFMVAVSFLGNQAIIFTALIFLTALCFWIVRLRLEAILIASVSIVSGIMNVLIKLLVSRPRPTTMLVDVLQYATGQSFPSGHVMSYVAFWGLLFSLGLILFKRDRWWHYALLIIPAFFVVMVGPSRIYLGDHWASDVLGAYLFGGLLLGIALWIYLRLKEQGVLTPKWDRSKTLFNGFHRHKVVH
jgi:membrane-associated phospholipid phosphatase